MSSHRVVSSHRAASGLARLLALALGLYALAPAVASAAAEITDVATAFEEDNPFDFRLRVGYQRTEKRALIKRDREGVSAGQTQIERFRDLAFAQHRDTLNLRAEFGIFQDLMIHAELPVILNESADYSFDQSGGSGCVFPPASAPTCVNASNSTTVFDGLVPATGFDAQHGGIPTTGSLLFRGVQRGAFGGSGLDAFDTFNFGLTWAPVSQRRDDTKPTWILAFEPQISIGNIRAYDRAAMNVNHGVSEGVHRLVARTAISHRFHWVEPYIGFWYMYPIARGDSLYKDYGPTQRVKNPQQQGGTVFGLEAVPFERPRAGHKIAIDLRGRIEGHFSGRGYSELWELLASSPALACDDVHRSGPGSTAAYNPACNANLTMNGYQGQPYTGLTTIENYATLGADVGLLVQVGQHARFRAAFEYSHDQSHHITGEDIGVPHNPSGRVSDPSEYNPAYRAVIDQLGRRYLVDDVNVYGFNVYGQIQF